MKEATKQKIWAAAQPAARLIVDILQKLAFPCALCGDLACCYYGEFRVANKLEIVVFPPSGTFPSIDTLKQTIASQSNGLFHLFQPHSRSSSNCVGLRYCHESANKLKMKTVNIELTYCHDAKQEQVWRMHDVPLAPLSFLVLRKLQKWIFVPPSMKQQSKVIDADVRRLLDMFEMYRPDNVPFSLELHKSSEQKALAFSSAYPECAHLWRKLGFEPLLVDTSRAADVTPIPQAEELSEHSAQDTEQFMIENPSRIQMVFLAGLTTVGILHKRGFSCAVYGSLACFLYGNVREPNDVDVLVLPPPQNATSIEDLKATIVHLDPVHFYLIPSKKPGANYKVLYYRLADSSTVCTVLTSCKVDLVFPGTLQLPNLPKTHINWDEGLPLIPFSLLLLQKLQGWYHHGISEDQLKRLKQRTDAKDVEGLLELSGTVSLQSSRPWSDRELFSEELEELSRQRVRLYCFIFPEWTGTWRLLGFESD